MCLFNLTLCKFLKLGVSHFLNLGLQNALTVLRWGLVLCLVEVCLFCISMYFYLVYLLFPWLLNNEVK